MEKYRAVVRNCEWGCCALKGTGSKLRRYIDAIQAGGSGTRIPCMTVPGKGPTLRVKVAVGVNQRSRREAKAAAGASSR